MSRPALPPEQAIVEIKAGREIERNFEIVFRAYFPILAAYFVNHGVERDQARDLAQEVFLAVHSGIGGLRDTAMFRGWLFGIARFKLYQSLGKRTRSVPIAESEDGPDNAIAAVADPAPSGLEKILENERRMKLRDALEELPQQMRACVKLNLVQELEYAEIADRLGVSVSSVKVQLHRARKKLASLLGPSFGIDAG